MEQAMWVLAFLVTGWEGKGDGFDIKAFWTQASCEEALAKAQYHPTEFNGKQYQGRYVCIYEPEWNTKPWHDAVEREAQHDPA